jgi:hypothetical protein
MYVLRKPKWHIKITYILFQKHILYLTLFLICPCKSFSIGGRVALYCGYIKYEKEITTQEIYACYGGVRMAEQIDGPWW